MELFTVVRKRRVKKSSVKTVEQVPVYCKLPGERMIECSMYKDWYHIDTCVGGAPLPSHLDSSLSWFCNKCL